MAVNLVGMHDREGKHLTPDGYCLITEELGLDNNRGGDYTDIAHPIVRLNHRYCPQGTIPRKEHYADFARTVGGYVQNSRGCKHWIIGNETNLSVEWPGVPITAADYRECFALCRNAIKAVQPDAVVMPAPVGPWNTQSGDWIAYFQDILQGSCDGIAIHAYGTLDKVYMESMPHRKYGFWAYQDFMDAIPPDKRGLPVFITEANENIPWRAGWFTGAVEEVVRWNASGKQPIHCVLPYCYIHRDQFGIDGKGDVQDEIRAVHARGYEAPQASGWGQRSRTEQVVIHHSATPPTVTAGAIRDYHLSRGYKGIAYHALVYQDGSVEQVNPWDRLTWHAGCGYDCPQNANAYSIGICLVGNFTKAPPPEAQLAGARKLVGELVGMFGPLRVIGHREAYRVSTECPGKAFTTEMVRSLLPPAGDLPEHETSTDPAVLAEKARWFAEEATRRVEAGDYAGALEILHSLVHPEMGLYYRLERLLKENE